MSWKGPWGVDSMKKYLRRLECELPTLKRGGFQIPRAKPCLGREPTQHVPYGVSHPRTMHFEGLQFPSGVSSLSSSFPRQRGIAGLSFQNVPSGDEEMHQATKVVLRFFAPALAPRNALTMPRYHSAMPLKRC